jgi:hypothetical protein
MKASPNRLQARKHSLAGLLFFFSLDCLELFQQLTVSFCWALLWSFFKNRELRLDDFLFWGLALLGFLACTPNDLHI